MTTRLQFELGKNEAKELESLMRLIGVKTKKDLLTNALTLLEWAVKERRAGRAIASVDEQGNTYPVLMPVLEKASKEN